MEKNKVYLHFNGECGCGRTVAWCNALKKMEEGVGNFHIKLQEGNADASIIKYMYSRMESGDLPDGSLYARFYTIPLKRKKEDICEIVAMDYGNSAIYPSEGNEDAKWYDNMLKYATIIIYTISGDVLHNYAFIDDENVSEEEKDIRRIELTRIANLIKSNMLKVEKLRDDKPPVLFYLTKSDMADCGGGKKELLKRFIYEYHFFPFAEEEKWKVLGCHSSLGRHLKWGARNNIISGFSPEGFEIPLLLAVGFLQSTEEKEWVEERCKAIDATLLRLKLMKNTFLLTGALLLGVFLYRKRIYEMDMQISALERKRSEIINHNPWRIRIKEILAYLESLGEDAVFYLNERGEEKPLENFFNISKNI